MPGEYLSLFGKSINSRMATVLSELHFLPCIGVFQHYAQAETIILEAQENYQKGSYRNRCHIIGANGLQRLSLPLIKGKNNQTNIREVELSDHQDWTRQHWQSIRSAYGNAPFFFYYEDELEAAFRNPQQYLWEFNLQLVRVLQWDKAIQETATYTSISPPGVRDIRSLYSPKQFTAEQQLDWPPYAQVFRERHGFVGNLSILDLLFCLGPQANLYLSEEITSKE